ncbi:uncharacterized protein LOC112086445 [Eutrema salsugineum]|uniref:uncharacterized protein LOC112086445 n=1 Tax=Eutrema salsugineum TaxID=72664 RepID=UPI000CED7E04|nr:uncharacterized protein LOC112086445 [Eutrema salsugineum]
MVVVRKPTRRNVRGNSSSRRSSVPEDSPPNSPIRPTDSPDSIHSPFYLTNGDNPGISLISEVLDGTNYDNWKIAMSIALDAKNKMAFIDGSLPRPIECDRNFRIWSRCNSMVKSWLLNSVSKQIYKSILRFNDASEIWKDLMTRFHITNLPRSYQLSQQIWSLQQGSLAGMAFSSSTLNFVGIMRATGNRLSSESWIIDSGATNHVSHDRNMFESLSEGLKLNGIKKCDIYIRIQYIY